MICDLIHCNVSYRYIVIVISIVVVFAFSGYQLVELPSIFVLYICTYNMVSFALFLFLFIALRFAVFVRGPVASFIFIYFALLRRRCTCERQQQQQAQQQQERQQ